MGKERCGRQRPARRDGVRRGQQERLQLTRTALWSGAPQTRTIPALEALPKIRELLFAGNYAEAQRLTDETPNLLGPSDKGAFRSTRRWAT
jgi:alpha-L-fucosidase 2